VSLESDIYNRSVGRDSTPGMQYSPETEELLRAALDNGGAVAQVAAEIAHPNGTFLSRAKEKLGNAMSNTIDVLSMGNYAVAALMDPDIDFQEAYKKKITPSQLIFGDSEAGGKVAQFSARLVTDVLLDPTTYVTFGTGSVVGGASKLSKIPLKASTARKLGLPTMETVDSLGNVVEEAVKFRDLSSAGQEQLFKAMSFFEEKLKKDTVESFYADKNIDTRLRTLASNIRKGGSEAAKKAMKFKTVDENIGGAEYILAEKLDEIYSAGKAMTDDQIRAMEDIAIDAAKREQADRMVRNALNVKRSEIEDNAKRMISNIIERNVDEGGVIKDKLGNVVKDQFGTRVVRDLANEWIDRGGIKVFGYSIVAGARLRAVGKLLQEWSYLDRVKGSRVGSQMQTGLNLTASLFSTNWTAAGRIPDSLIQIRNRSKNKQDVAQSELFSFIPRLYQKLGIQEGEDKMISAAIAADMPPTSGGDARLETLWSLIHTKQGNEVAEDIAAGKYGDDIGRMWQAANGIRKQMKKNLIMAHEAGLHVFPQKNYIPGVLNEQKSLLNPFAKYKTARAVNAEKSELVKFRNVDDPNDVLYGSEGDLRLERLSKVEERNRIEKELTETVLKSEEKTAKIKDEITALWDQVFDKQAKAILKGSKGAIDVTDDPYNYEALVGVIRDSIPQVDRKRILRDYAAKYYEDGAKLTSAGKLSAEDVLKLKEDLAMGDPELDDLAKTILNNTEEFGIEVVPAPKAGTVVASDAKVYQKKLKEMMELVTDIGIKGKKEYLSKAIKESGDSNKFTEVLAKLSDEWHKDPGSINRTMESILGKEFDLRQVMDDLYDTRKALELELKGPGLKKVADRWFYKDKESKIYERVRATAKEINDNYFNSEEMFTESALKQTLVGSLTAIRAANSKFLLDDIAKRFGVPKGNAPSNFVKVGVSGLQKEVIESGKFSRLEDGKFAFKNGIGDELYFHPTVAQSIDDMMKVMSEDPGSEFVAASWDKLTNLWKASVTSIWPAFHGRNAISNVFQHMMDIGWESLNPVNHVISGRLIKLNSELEDLGMKMATGDADATRKFIETSNKVILTDSRGHKWTAGDIIRVSRDNIIAFNPTLVGQIDVQMSSRDIAQQLMEHVFNKRGSAKAIASAVIPTSQSFGPFRVGRYIGNMIESQARLVDFVANLRKTGDVEMAAFQTKQFLFDYQNLTHFERNVMRRIIPFYTYSRKNIELQVKTLLTQPGKHAAFADAITTFGDVYGDGRVTAEERAMLPEWMQDSLNIVTSRNAENISLITTLGTPFEQPFSQFGNLAGSLNPLIKGPVEKATGFSFFNGRPVSQVTDARAFSSPLMPELLKDFIGYTEITYNAKNGEEKKLYVSLRPENLNLLNNLPFIPRTISTLRMFENKELSAQETAFGLLFGMKIDDVNLLTEAERREKELQKQLEDLLDQADLGYRFDRFQLKKK